jgi:hypothetical protein
VVVAVLNDSVGRGGGAKIGGIESREIKGRKRETHNATPTCTCVHVDACIDVDVDIDV